MTRRNQQLRQALQHNCAIRVGGLLTRIFLSWAIWILAGLGLAGTLGACGPAPTPPPITQATSQAIPQPAEITAAAQKPAPTVRISTSTPPRLDNSPTPPVRFQPTSAPSQTEPAPQASPSPSFTPTLAPPPPLPWDIFTHRLIRPGVQPTSYVENACEYLRQRWGSDRAAPGAVVAPIMFHGIRAAGKELLEGDGISITAEDFTLFIEYARRAGFETITTGQLINFLYHNAPIPTRSMVMIVDDRRPGTVENFFLPVLEANEWTATLGWITGDSATGGDNAELWAWIERLNASGRLDMQSHGFKHIYITEFTGEAEIRQELYEPISIMEAHFGQRPLAFVWPGGNFTAQSVSIGREAGYQLGFTATSRGPLMYNWIPQGDQELAAGDPLMTLPRFWSTDLTLSLDVAIQVGDAARQFAEENFPAEAAYYQTYCGGSLR